MPSDFHYLFGGQNIEVGVKDGSLISRVNGVEAALSGGLPTSGGTITGNIAFSPTKKIQLFSNDPSGSAQRLVELWAGSITDRPSYSFFDYQNRHVVSFNCHDTLPPSEGGAQLKQVEIKTLADPLSPNPSELRTRLGIQYDQQRITWGATFTRYFEINQGENPILSYPNFATEDFGLRLRTLDSAGASFVAAQLLATVDATDNIVANLDVKNNNTTKSVNLIIGRNTTTSSATGATIHVKKMDGSNTSVVQLNPRSTPPTYTWGYTGDTGFNVIIGSDTGLKIGTATTQKLAFFNAAPVAQQSGVGTATGYTAGTTAGTFHTDDKYSGNVGATAYTINGLVAALKNLGLLAQ